MIEDKEYHNLFLSIYNFYNKYVYDIKNFDFENIYICNNIKNKLTELNLNDYNVEETNNTSGATILPIDTLSKMIVIVEVTNNYNKSDVSTLMHELTHVYDFINYSKKYTCGEIQNFRGKPLFEIYSLFSEFHAHYCDEMYSTIYTNVLTQANEFDEIIKKQDKLLN